MHEYQRKRVLTFLDPDRDPLGAGYHITQSKIAIGSGGLFGKGFLQGTQSSLNFLPEKQTDFIFTTFVEEWGMVGACVLLALFALVLVWGFSIALRSQHHFGRLVALGVTAMMFLYVFINTAMVMGLLPVVGVPLPLVSNGGTAMVSVMFACGLLIGVNVYRDAQLPLRRAESRAESSAILRLSTRRDRLLAIAAPSRAMPRYWGRIAQLVEQLTLNQRVPGSSPGAPTMAFNGLGDRPTGTLRQPKLNVRNGVQLLAKSEREGAIAQSATADAAAPGADEVKGAALPIRALDGALAVAGAVDEYPLSGATQSAVADELKDASAIRVARLRSPKRFTAIFHGEGHAGGNTAARTKQNGSARND